MRKFIFAGIVAWSLPLSPAAAEPVRDCLDRAVAQGSVAACQREGVVPPDAVMAAPRLDGNKPSLENRAVQNPPKAKKSVPAPAKQRNKFGNPFMGALKGAPYWGAGLALSVLNVADEVVEPGDKITADFFKVILLGPAIAAGALGVAFGLVWGAVVETKNPGSTTWSPW